MVCRAASAASELGTLERPVAVAKELAWLGARVGAVLLGSFVGAKVLVSVDQPELKILWASSPGLRRPISAPTIPWVAFPVLVG